MPKVNIKNNRLEQIKRNHVIIKNAARIQMGSMENLASAIGVKPQTLYSSLKKGSIKAVNMAHIIRVLRLDNETVLALMGNPKRCRFEVGYEPL